jgi:hypothetical protein
MPAAPLTLQHIVQHMCVCVCVVTFHISMMLRLPLPGLLQLSLPEWMVSRSNNFVRLLTNELGRKNLLVLLS